VEFVIEARQDARQFTQDVGREYDFDRSLVPGADNPAGDACG
jgi:hypothetical protein